MPTYLLTNEGVQTLKAYKILNEYEAEGRKYVNAMTLELDGNILYLTNPIKFHLYLNLETLLKGHFTLLGASNETESNP